MSDKQKALAAIEEEFTRYGDVVGEEGNDVLGSSVASDAMIAEIYWLRQEVATLKAQIEKRRQQDDAGDMMYRGG